MIRNILGYDFIAEWNLNTMQPKYIIMKMLMDDWNQFINGRKESATRATTIDAGRLSGVLA